MVEFNFNGYQGPDFIYYPLSLWIDNGQYYQEKTNDYYCYISVYTYNNIRYWEVGYKYYSVVEEMIVSYHVNGNTTEYPVLFYSMPLFAMYGISNYEVQP